MKIIKISRLIESPSYIAAPLCHNRKKSHLTFRLRGRDREYGRALFNTSLNKNKQSTSLTLLQWDKSGENYYIQIHSDITVITRILNSDSYWFFFTYLFLIIRSLGHDTTKSPIYRSASPSPNRSYSQLVDGSPTPIYKFFHRWKIIRFARVIRNVVFL